MVAGAITHAHLFYSLQNKPDSPVISVAQAPWYFLFAEVDNQGRKHACEFVENTGVFNV